LWYVWLKIKSCKIMFKTSCLDYYIKIKNFALNTICIAPHLHIAKDSFITTKNLKMKEFVLWKLRGPLWKYNCLTLHLLNFKSLTLLQKHGFYAMLVASCLKLLYNQYLEYTSSLKWLNVSIMTKIKSSNFQYD
jgi:hypothetical protein